LNDEFSHDLQTDHLKEAVKIEEYYCDWHSENSPARWQRW
jgi:hypothetical protein